MNMKYIVLAIIALLIIGGGWWFITQSNEAVVIDDTTDRMPVEPDGGIGDGAEPLDELIEDENEARGPMSTLGASVSGTDIVAHHFGTGATEVLLVANLHGGDAPNTAALMEEFVEYFEDNAEAIPEGVTVTVIPTVNPDGLVSDSRFNENNVDLNRNFACDWSATSMWRDQEVSGGSAAFSEPEAKAIRDYVADNAVAAAIVWFAAEGKVYPSACEGTPSRDSVTLAATFATAAGYPTDAEFDAYQINGDMVNWLASMNVPAISVLLSNRTATEWSKNRAGVEAILATYDN